MSRQSMNARPPRIVKFMLTLALQASFYYACSQSQALDNLVKNFNEHRINNLQEKLYVHTDQALYLTGETLWLKIYCVDGARHTPIDISKIAYLELLDTGNQPVLQSKIALTSGTGSGAIFLPATLATGNYTLRAYTQWMKNFKTEFFFHKTLAIINVFQKIETPTGVVAPAPPLAQFFPEGGTMISGLRTNVAFQVTDAEGTGIAFRGFLLTEKDDTVGHFQPEKFGIGRFSYTPTAGTRYRATIVEGSGRKTNFNLPEPANAGYALHLEDRGDEIKLSLQHSFPGRKNVYLFIHSRQRISTAQLFVIEKETVITIKKSSLFSGISHITLFDEALQPVCERLYFKSPGNPLKIERINGESEFGIRKKVTLDFSVSDPGQASPVSLSVAVVKKDSLTRPSGNILSFLDIESDLKGRIESPEYYTSSAGAEVGKALDNLMLTHGWRRYIWADIQNVKTSHAFIPEYRGHFIYGKITGPSGTPVAGIESYLSAPGKNIQFSVARSNSRGEVRFEMKNLFGDKKLVAQTNLRKDSLFRIKIDNPFSDQFEMRKLPRPGLSPALENQLLSRSVGMQVQDVFYKERSERFANPEIDSSAFYGAADESYVLDDYTRFPTMEEVLREYVKGVLVRKTKATYSFHMWDRTYNTISHEDPLILIDGIPVFDVNKAVLFDPLKLKRLDLVTRKYFMGSLTFHGIVSYQSYSGDLPDFRLDPKAVILDYQGLQLQQEFYSPQYETPLKLASRLPDRRNLLYWSPTIIPGSDGKLTLEFYTGDIAGEYSITIEGINGKGEAGSHTSSFIVK
jgi:hypothetical protein